MIQTYSTEGDENARLERESRTLVLPRNRSPQDARSYDVVLSARQYSAFETMSQIGAIDNGESVKLVDGTFSTVLPGRSLPKGVLASSDIDPTTLPMLVATYTKKNLKIDDRKQRARRVARIDIIVKLLKEKIISYLNRRCTLNDANEVNDALQLTMSRNQLAKNGYGSLLGSEMENMTRNQYKIGWNDRVHTFSQFVREEIESRRVAVSVIFEGENSFGNSIRYTHGPTTGNLFLKLYTLDKMLLNGNITMGFDPKNFDANIKLISNLALGPNLLDLKKCPIEFRGDAKIV